MVVKKKKLIILGIFALLILSIIMMGSFNKDNYSVENRYREIKEFAIKYNKEFDVVTYDLIKIYNDEDYYNKYNEYLDNDIHIDEKNIILKNDYLFNINFIQDENNNLLYCEYMLRELENKYKEHDYSIIYIMGNNDTIEKRLQEYSRKYEKINDDMYLTYSTFSYV